MKKIKNTSELPKWFKLEKYDKAATLSALDWHQQFFIRITANHGSANIDEELEHFEYDEPGEDDNVYYCELRQAIRENPIINIYSDMNFSEFKNAPPYGQFKTNNPCDAAGIHSLTAFEYLLLGNQINQEKYQHLMEWRQQTLINRSDSMEVPSFIHDPLHTLNDTHRCCYGMEALWIDLAYPDNILIEHFEYFLKIRRREYDSANDNISRYHKPDFENWHRFGVLPYIDLIMWARDENVTIPYRVLADAIFPSGERGEEAIRKTTKPLVQSLLNQSTLTKLETLALGEIAEQKYQ